MTEATGREHAGAGGTDQRSNIDLPVNPLPQPNNANAVRTYTERYTYDNLGNFTTLQHIANGGGWTQRYRYAYEQTPADRNQPPHLLQSAR